MGYLFIYIAALMVLPLIGLYRIEQGDLNGYPNGSIPPYVIYLCVFFLSYLFFSKRNFTFSKPAVIAPDSSNKGIEEDISFFNRHPKRTNLRLVFLLFFVVLLVLFAFNGISVLTGAMNKGEYRSQMGYLGFVMAIPTKFIFPACFARLCFVYYNRKNLTGRYKFDGMFGLAFLCCIVLGLTFGDKSSIITLLLSGVIALMWDRTRFWHVFISGILAVSILVVTAMMFDDFLANRDLSNVLDYIAFRAFSLSAESCWKVWELIRTDNLVFDYPATLLGIFGSGGVYLLTGVSKYDFIAYKFGFGRAVTALLYPGATQIEAINAGTWNITPTAYVEGLLIGGVGGTILIAIVAGIILAYIKKKIDRGIRVGNFALSATFIIYFMNVYVAWVTSGGVTTLIHPVSIFGSLISYYTIRYVERLRF